jgi:hypothetical protein
MIIQSTNHLLNIIRAGYSIHAAGGVIKISPAQCIDDDMANLIRTHKAALITLLEREVNNG